MAVTAHFGSFPVVSGTPWRGVRYFCTTRQGGHSQPPFDTLNLATHVEDDANVVAANRLALAQAIGATPVWLEQVHGTAIFDADISKPDNVPPVADAAITSRANIALAIMTADCLPVVIADQAGRAVAVAHAGWRGLAGGVLEKTVQALQCRLPADAQLRAWIGPAITQAVFEVGADVYEAFCDADPLSAAFFVLHAPNGVTNSKWLADLSGLARFRLAQAGVRYIECSGWCTFRQPDLFFSYRRNAQTGRMATLAWLEPASDLP